MLILPTRMNLHLLNTKLLCLLLLPLMCLGHIDGDDNCPFHDNEDQLDNENAKDDIGDVCDPDDDNDGKSLMKHWFCYKLYRFSSKTRYMVLHYNVCHPWLFAAIKY